jgi:hypothetical protein
MVKPSCMIARVGFCSLTASVRTRTPTVLLLLLSHRFNLPTGAVTKFIWCCVRLSTDDVT